MKHQFSRVPTAEIPRSAFNRTHTHKTTFDAGKLIPFYIDEVLPGDTFSVNSTLFARLATPIVPIMDNVFLDTQYFFVPLRLLWANFQKFMGEQDNPDDSTDYLCPKYVFNDVSGVLPQSLDDYFGVPTQNQNPTLEVNAFWHRAYNLIYNEWYRDQNLQDSVVVNTDDGPENQTDAHYTLLNRGKRHDYFTSCLPWPQKGPGVELPIGGQATLGGLAPVITQGSNISTGAHPSMKLLTSTGAAPGNITQLAYSAANGLRGTGTTDPSGSSYYPSNLGTDFDDAASTAYADLSTATAVTINAFREAFQLQRLLERDARGGTRYTEIIRSHFAVTSPDARLQRPEYLGGKSTPLNIQSVPQTSQTSLTPQGNLAGFGTINHTGDGFSKSFTEHGVILGILSVRADLTYQQGLHRMFSRNTKYDFYWPALAHLGEQEVLNKELYYSGAAADDDVFGYQERWAEYRYYPSKITGKLRSSDPNSLDVWHLSQDFTSLPVLNDSFIQENPPIDRVIAVPSEPHFILDSYIQCRTVRPMPTYSVPGMIDHF